MDYRSETIENGKKSLDDYGNTGDARMSRCEYDLDKNRERTTTKQFVPVPVCPLLIRWIMLTITCSCWTANKDMERMKKNQKRFHERKK